MTDPASSYSDPPLIPETARPSMIGGILPPEEMSPEEIFTEIATLLAKGYLNYIRQAESIPSPSHVAYPLDILPLLSPLTENPLDFPDDRRVNCAAG